MSKRHVCSDCGARADEPGDCKRCGEGPLLDLDGEGNAELLRQADRDRAERRRGRLTTVAVPLGIVGGVGLSYLLPGLLPIPFGRVIQAVVVMVVVAYGALRLLSVAFPAEVRFPYLVEEASRSVRGAAGDMRRQELKKPILVLAVLCVVGAVIGGLSWWQKTVAEAEALERRRQAGQAWADLEQCLVGEPIVVHDDLLAALRSVELAGGRSEAEDGWPRRCARHVTALYQTLDGKHYGAGLKQQLEERFACAQSCVLDQPADQLGGISELVRALPIVAAAPTVDPPPRLASELLAKQDFPQVAPGDAVLQDRDLLEDGRVRLLFNSRGQGLSVCEIDPDRSEPLDCSDLRLPLSSGTVQLVPGSDDLVLSGRERALDDDRFFARDGEPVVVHEGKRDGFTLTKREGRSWRVARVRGGEVEVEETLKMPKKASDPWLVAGQIAWLLRDEDRHTTLRVRALAREGKELLGEPELLGAVAEQAEQPRSCVQGDRVALLYGVSPTTWHVAHYDGSRWAAPVGLAVDERPTASPAAKGEPEPGDAAGRDSARRAALRDAAEYGMIGLLNSGAGDAASPWGGDLDDSKMAARGNMWGDSTGGRLGLSGIGRSRGAAAPPPRARRRPQTRPHLPRRPFTCGDGAAYVTWREPGSGGEQIGQLRCDAGGCTERSVQIPGMAVKEMWLVATLTPAEGGKERVLLVWRTPVGDLRMRLAPIEELAEASDRLLMDSADHGGPTTVDLQAFVGHQAVVFLFRGLGMHALRIDAGGRVDPLG